MSKRRSGFMAAVFAAGLSVFFVLADDRAYAQSADPEISAAQRIVLNNPANPEASFQLARIAASKGEFPIAIAALERLLILYPDLANIRLELGVLYLRTGSPALGASFIRKAMESPDAPPEVRARADELLAVADEQGRPLRYSAQVTVGLIHDSNANFGPPDGTTVGGIPVTDGTGDGDSSVFFSVSGQLRYDPGLQAGHLLALDAGYYGRRYGDQSDLDLDRLFIAPGIDLNLSHAMGRPASLGFRADFSELRRDGERYLRERGLRASFGYPLDPRNQLNLGAYWADQDYISSAAFPANDRRDGKRSGVQLRFAHALDPQQSVAFEIGAGTKSAAVDYEAYREYGISVDYRRAIKPLWGDRGPWLIGASASVTARRYDGPDPAIDADASQKDRIFGIVARLGIPLTEKAALSLEGGHTRQSSTYDIKEYDNTYLYLGLSHRF